MRRKQVTQFINTTWFPKHLKLLIAEFLTWFVLKTNASKPFMPLINQMLEENKTNTIINIDIPIGAGIDTVTPFLDKKIKVRNLTLAEFNTQQSGLYLFVNAFHQLPPQKAQQIVAQIAKSKNPLIIVEGNNDSLWQIVGMTFFVPLTVILTAFFVKPFRFTRIIFTYLLPILPIALVIDGCLALLKLYNPKDLLTLSKNIELENHQWEAGKKDNGRGGKIMYLLTRKK
jgi:hypothetical protein